MIFLQSYFWMNGIVMINIRNLDLNLLVVLVALYEERSVTRAADRLALTQPTVSGMLRRLRDVLGDELFVRTSHGVIPTPRGETLAKGAKDILASTQALLSDQGFDPKSDQFSLTLAGSDYLQNSVLGKFAATLMDAAPNIRLSLQPPPSANVESLLARGQLDLFFQTGGPLGLNLPNKHVLREIAIPISSYRHHARGEHVPLEDLQALRHVKLIQPVTQVTLSLDAAFEARGLTRETALYVPNLSAMFNAMRDTELVAFIPETIAWLNRDSVKSLTTDIDLTPAEVRVYWHPRMTGDPRHEWLLQMLDQTVRGLTLHSGNKR